MHITGGDFMVRCNLAILLAERNLKITKVSNDTGISRTTLTYLFNNYSKGIQYDTLNTLCTYLHITPSDLISYVPIDINITSIHVNFNNREQYELQLEITLNGISQKCDLYGNIYLHFADFSIPNSENYITLPISADIDISLYDSDDDPELENENIFILSAFHKLPIAFLKDIEADIVADIKDEIYFQYNLGDYINQIDSFNISFDWCDLFPRK